MQYTPNNLKPCQLKLQVHLNQSAFLYISLTHAITEISPLANEIKPPTYLLCLDSFTLYILTIFISSWKVKQMVL